MGVPHGGKDVPYNLPIEADIELGIELFCELGYAPKMTDLVDLIKGSENSDDTFKRMWLLLAGNTVIAPTTSNKVSPQWYVVLVSFFCNYVIFFLVCLITLLYVSVVTFIFFCGAFGELQFLFVF